MQKQDTLRIHFYHLIYLLFLSNKPYILEYLNVLLRVKRGERLTGGPGNPGGPICPSGPKGPVGPVSPFSPFVP